MANDATDFSVLTQANIVATQALLDNKSGHLSYTEYHDQIQKLRDYVNNKNTSQDWWDNAWIGTFKGIFDHDEKTNKTVVHPVFYQWLRQLGLQTFTVMRDAEDRADVPQIPSRIDLFTPEGYKEVVEFLEACYQRINSSLEKLQKVQTEKQAIIQTEAKAQTAEATSFVGMSSRQRVILALEQLAKEKPSDLELHLQNNPALKQTIENYAVAASFTHLDPNEIGGYLDKIQGLRSALSTNPQFLTEFSSYFARRIQYFRLQMAKDGEIRTLDTDDPEIKDQVVEAVATMAKTTGPMTTVRILTSSPEENRKRIEEKPVEGSSREELQEYEDDRRAYGIQAAVQKQVESQNRLLRLFGRDQENPYQDNTEFLDSLGGFTTTEIKPETNLDQLDQVQGSSSEKQGKKEKTQELTSTVQQLQGLSKFVANPSAPFIAGGAAVGGMGLVGLITQGVAGGLGAATTATGGAIAGGLIGTAILPGIGTVIGSVLGAIGASLGSLAWHPYGGASLAQLTGGFEAQTFANVNLGVQAYAPATKALAASAGQAGVSAAAHGGLSAGQSASAAAAKTAGSILTGTKGVLSALPQLSIPFTGVAASTALVTAPIGTALIVTSFVVMPTILSSFLVGGDISSTGQVNQYVEVTKEVNPPDGKSAFENTDLPERITYVITITPKKDPSGQPYKITIISASDKYSVASKQDPAPAAPPEQNVSGVVGELPPGGRKIQYLTDYGQGQNSGNYTDTRTTNVFLMKFDVQGSDAQVGATGQTVTTAASVTFGNPPGAGCWPTNGTVSVLAYYGDGSPHATWNGRLSTAADIGNALGTPVITPYDGTAIACTDGQDDPQVACYNNPPGDTLRGTLTPYGNHVVLANAQFGSIMFAHLSQFWDSSVEHQTTKQFKAGDIIGYTGSTGGGNMANHLHYEALSVPFLLTDLVPKNPVPALGLKVFTTTCGN